MVSYSFQGNKRFWTSRDEEENEKIFSEQSQRTGIKIPDEIKPVYLANAEYEVEKWPVTQIMRLLRLYAAHRCLWDVACKDNHNRKMRQAALIDITAAMGGGVIKEQIVQKINVIRATYRYEKKRIKQRIRKGMGARTKLKWFALADAFLRKVPKKGQKNGDPCNSDSDLEDTIVFSINPESLVPLESEFRIETTKESQPNLESVVELKEEIFSDDSQTMVDLWDNEKLYASNDDCLEDNKPLKQLKLELQENDLQRENYDKEIVVKSSENFKEMEDIKLDFTTPTKDGKNSKEIKQKSSKWCFDDTLRFIELLKSHDILCDINLRPSDSLETTLALKTIANDMVKPVKSIEKRWHIFKQTYAEEKQKILKNPLYKPKYNWWSQAENLMESVNNMESTNQNQTESIYIQENENPESSNIDNEEEYEKFLQNPIPSVAPLSNMNEAMASLFNHPEIEDLSLESNTNSSFPKENDTNTCTKFVWHGVEDDLLEGKWSLKHSVKFLRLYGVHKCLWNLNDPDYRSRPLRNAALEDIAASMGHGLTASYVAKKIKIFRITYMQQRKRLLEATEKGETPEILLKWFPLADSFLRTHIGLRSIKSDAKEMPQFDYQYVYANLNLIDPALLTDFRGKGTQNAIEIGGNDSDVMDLEES